MLKVDKKQFSIFVLILKINNNNNKLSAKLRKY